jgi:hypothetical protein
MSAIALTQGSWLRAGTTAAGYAPRTTVFR